MHFSERVVFLRKVFVTFTSSNSIGSYAIAVKFSAKQINFIKKCVHDSALSPAHLFALRGRRKRGLGTRLSTICKIMNIYIDFRIFVSASQSVQYFWKSTKTQIKLKPKFFYKIEHMLLSRSMIFLKVLFETANCMDIRPALDLYQINPYSEVI